MKISVSSDEYTDLVKAVCGYIEKKGHEVVYYGPSAGEEGGTETDWPCVTEKAVTDVIEQRADEAIVMCWTGTGASIAANKVKGIRAALCHDAETAKGAFRCSETNISALNVLKVTWPITCTCIIIQFTGIDKSAP